MVGRKLRTKEKPENDITVFWFVFQKSSTETKMGFEYTIHSTKKPQQQKTKNDYHRPTA